MDSIALAAVTRKTADILGNLVVEEWTRLYWMNEDIRWIQTEMTFIQSFLKDAEVEKDASQKNANLVITIRDLAYDVEDIIDTFFPEMVSRKRKGLLSYLECLCCIFCNWCTSHRFVMKVEGIRRRVEAINRARGTYAIPNSSGVGGEESDPPQKSFPHFEEPIIVGLEMHIEKIEELLAQKEQYRVIPIVGLPGVGKTTLAKKVFNSAKAKFDCHAWVSAPKNPRVKDILRDIARQVGVEEEQWEKNADMEANLYEFLKQKRYLIVIDDIWNTETWDALKVGIPGNSEFGSALIISSRQKDIGRYAGGEDSLIELQNLNDVMSWKLFSQIVKLSPQCPDESSDSPELLKLGRKIVQSCEGLPLSIVAVARLLLSKERREHEWKSVQIKIGQKGDKSSHVLDFSYGDLPSNLKPCFLYFGLFPEDCVFPASLMINLWIAEGYIQPRDRHTLEDVGEDYLTELTNRNLIQIEKRRFDGRIRSCRIHHVLHSFCVSIAKEEKFFNTCHGLYSDLDTTARRVAIHHGSICEYISKHQSPKLRALLYLNKDEEILREKKLVDFLNGFRFIRVLCLEGLVLPQSFPNDINSLTHLRFLRLRGSSLKIIPSTISNLQNLQTLDVEDCENLNLPTVIWKMQSLRHILLSPTTTFRHPFKSRCSTLFTTQRPKIIEEVCLPNLQSLCTLNGDFLKAECLSKFTNLKKLGLHCCVKQFVNVLTNTLLIPKKLEKLQLVMRDDGPFDVKQSLPIGLPDSSSSNNLGNQNRPKPVGPMLNFSEYENLRNLYLEGPLVQLPKFTTTLTKLTLVQSRLEQDPMGELGKLGNLKKLQLHQSWYTGSELVVAGARAFPQLQELAFEHMSSLPALKIEGGVMPLLRCAKIEGKEIHSDKLRSIFSNCLIPMSKVTTIEFENIALEIQSKVANKGQELISEEEIEPEIIEIQKGISGNRLELGQSSSSGAPNMDSN